MLENKSNSIPSFTIRELLQEKINKIDQTLEKAKSKPCKTNNEKIKIKNYYLSLLESNNYFIEKYLSLRIYGDLKHEVHGNHGKYRTIGNIKKDIEKIEKIKDFSIEIYEETKARIDYYVEKNEVPIIKNLIIEGIQIHYGKNIAPKLKQIIKEKEGKMWSERPKFLKALKELEENNFKMNLNKGINGLIKDDELSQSIRWTTVYLSHFESKR